MGKATGGSALKKLNKKSTVKKQYSKTAAPKSSTNPFELKFTTQHHNVLNRKKASTKKATTLSQSRKRSNDKRISTLLPQLKDRAKDNSFIDKRFGENNPGMSLEDKLMARFIMDKKKKSENSGMFNLEQDEEDELTHFGQSLSADMDDDTFINRDEEYGEQDNHGIIDKHTVSQAHFGGFDDDEEQPDGRKKSKSEIMQEIIAKSKFHKSLRQKIAVENKDIIDDVDDDLDEIRQLLTENVVDEEVQPKKKVVDEFDQLVRQLAHEKRSKPTDRTKSQEEMAVEQRAKLEKLEADRIKRMSEMQGPAVQRKPQADDLDGNWKMEDDDDEGGELEYVDGVLVSGTLNFAKKRKWGESIEEEKGEEDSEEGSGDSDSDEDSESEEENNEDLEDNEAEDEAEEKQEDDLELSIKSKTQEELPFVFKMPNSYEEFLDIIADKTDEQVDTIFSRIRTLYHVKLAQDNKDKLLTFLKLLLIHIRKIGDDTQQTQLPTTLINAYLKHISSILSTPPSTKAPTSVFIDFFTTYIQTQVKKLSSTITKTRKFPSTNSVGLLMKLVGGIYSTSDFQHEVVTGCVILLAQYLDQCAVLSRRDISTGLWFCKILIEYQEKSKRFIPEVLNYIYRIMHSCLSLSKSTCMNQFSLHEKDSLKLLDVYGKSKNGEVVERLNIAKYLSIGENEINDTVGEFSQQVFLECINLATLLSKQYLDSPSFIELFTPLVEMIDVFVKNEHAIDFLRAESNHLLQTVQGIMNGASLKRKPLQLQKRKPVPIATFIPKFNTNYSLDRKSQDPNKARNEAQKTARQYKKEFRGAQRELRKDVDFISREKLKDIKSKDAAYKKKISGIMGDLGNQEGEMRGFEKGKKRSKR